MKKPAGKPNGAPAANNNMLYTAIGVGALAFVFLVTTFMFFQKSKQMEQKALSASAEVQELKQPKYDPEVDLLTEQCESQNIACISTTTRSPNIELLKFLVNFKQYEGTQYRLFLEIQHTGEVESTPYKYQCDAGKKAFYICQDISATHPADVLRVFERSYATLSPNATYQFNLMVKPTAEQVSAAPIRMTPKDNLVLTDANGNELANNSIQAQAQAQGQGQGQGQEVEANPVADVNANPVVETQEVSASESIAN